MNKYRTKCTRRKEIEAKKENEKQQKHEKNSWNEIAVFVVIIAI